MDCWVMISQYLWFYRFTSNLIRPNNIYLHLEYIYEDLLSLISRIYALVAEFIASYSLTVMWRVALSSDEFYRTVNNWVLVVPLNIIVAIMAMLSIWNLLIGAWE